MKMIKIEIDYVVPVDDTALIVLAPTGISYTAQCDGLACSHPEAEGFVLNVGEFASDFDTCKYGCADLSRPDGEEMRQKLAEDFDKYAKEETAYWRYKIRFDWSRIDQTMEGWIPVLLNGKLDAFLDFEFKDAPGFIHNGNCD